MNRDRKSGGILVSRWISPTSPRGHVETARGGEWGRVGWRFGGGNMGKRQVRMGDTPLVYQINNLGCRHTSQTCDHTRRYLSGVPNKQCGGAPIRRRRMGTPM